MQRLHWVTIKTMIKLSKLKTNPANPRTIKDDRFDKLCQSLETFAEKMMPLRPIVIDEDGIILGGNMRFKALKHLGYKEVPSDWVKQANDLTEAEKKEFVVKDNVGFGEFDFDMLADDFDKDLLDDWGVEGMIDKIIENGEAKEIDLTLQIAQELSIGKDFIIIVFENNEEWESAKKRLALKKVRADNLNKIELCDTGIERVLLFSEFEKRYENSNSIKGEE